MINNIDVLKKFLHFKDDYYMRIICISRFKDTGSQKVLNSIFIGTEEAFDKQISRLIEEADNKKFRIYLDIIPRKLNSEFLEQIAWRRDKVFGLKQQCTSPTCAPLTYNLYDADGNVKELNEKVQKGIEDLNIQVFKIKSSDNGEHWIMDTEDIEKLSKYLKDINFNIRSHHYEACLYNPN